MPDPVIRTVTPPVGSRLAQLVQEYEKAYPAQKRVEELKDSIKNEIDQLRQLAGTTEDAVDLHVEGVAKALRFAPQTSMRTDGKKLAADHPELVARYEYPSTYVKLSWVNR